MLKKPGLSIVIGLFGCLIICVAFASEELQGVPSLFSKTNEPTVSIDLIDLKDADIQSVLRILSIKGNVNIVAASDVTGNITVKLTNVSWQKALDVILKTYDYGYERDGNIITVTGMDRLTTQKEAEQKLYNIQPVITEVFTLKYLDADDMKETLQPQLSPRGTITVLKSTMTPGWEFTSSAKGESLKKVAREQQASTARSKTLIISDIPAFIEKIKKVIAMLDSPPQQILIEARIIEVNEDVLRDIGFEWGTGSSGAESTTITSTPAIKSSSGATVSAVGGHLLNTQVTPSAFDPESTGLTATNTGMKFLYQKLMGSQFEAVMHALQENANANTLSAPRILTLNNQEATILVGTKYPILTSEVSSESGTTVTSTLDYYQDIGIQLNVVPQISGDKYINMVIHPAVTAYDTSNTVGTNAYPVISTREAQTRVLLEDNQTIVIGGLLKDVKKKTNMGIPFLKDIPILGNLFGRDTNDTEKVDLLIFITATIIKPTDMYRSATPDERMTSYQIEQQMIRERLKRNQLTGVEIKR